MKTKFNKFDTIYESVISHYLKSDDINIFEKLVMKEILNNLEKIFPGVEISYEDIDYEITITEIKHENGVIKFVYNKLYESFSINCPVLSYLENFSPETLSELVNDNFYNIFRKLKEDLDNLK